MERIAIFGPGLIGGSLAMALRGRCPGIAVSVWGRNPAQLEEILRRDLADAVETDPAAAVQGAGLVMLCTPVGAMADLAAAFANHLKPGAIVTDAGSVKACVARKLTPLLGQRFLGGHPMAGSELSGLAAARADLFQDAPCILTPLADTPPPIIETITRFWNTLGSRVTVMTPEEHDFLVARLSHLPHALAFALVNLVSASLPATAPLLAGGSFRDGTRVAASDPALWTGIFSENRGEVVAALRDMAELLGTFAGNLEAGNTACVLDFLTRAKQQRDSLPLPPPDDNP